MNKKKRKEAIEFLNTNRGQYIVGQALKIALEALSKEEGSRKQLSNMADMRFLLDNIFINKEAK
jgi:hypothetical protein